MIVVYQAQNSIDAHLLRGMLEQRGITASVTGEFLQGGAGELPAGGVVGVSVADADAESARQVVNEFETNLQTEVDWDEAGWQIESHTLPDAGRDGDRPGSRGGGRESPLFESPEFDRQYWLWTGAASLAAIALVGWVLYRLQG